MPICRAYARHIVDDGPPDPVICYLWGLYFWTVHRYWPCFKSPRSISEKVWNRMLFDRDPKWIMLSDKLRVRDYVASKVGSEYLIPLLWSGGNPEEVPFDELPSKFVIKTTHGCGYNIYAKDKTQLDQTKARRQLGKWLRENYCQEYLVGMEWGYKNIIPAIIVESFLEDNGKVPVDYKFLCYSGRAEFVQVDYDRFTEDHTRTFFNRDFNRLEFTYGKKLYPGKVVRPDNYKDMIQLAESIAREFDFMRVDLYSVGGQIYVGELTCYPGGGVIRFIPRNYDFLLGERWKSK